MAIAERYLARRFNRPGHEVVNHRTFAIVSDGDLMEGISNEASSIAGHLRLGKLTFLYDSNQVSLDGPTSMAFTEDVGKRYDAYGWQVLRIEDGNTDLDGIDRAISQAEKETRRPTLIIVRTTIGYGSPHKAGTSEAHGSPLGPEEVVLTKRALGWEHEDPFFVPDDALAHFRSAIERGSERQSEWQERFDSWARENSDLAEEWRRGISGELPPGWDADLPKWKAGEKEATRAAAGKVLNVLAERVPALLGGDADLSVSTSTKLKEEPDFDGQTGEGRNIHFGVREHAMAGIANGMAYHGGVRPFVATFFCFSDYMRPSVRLSAVSELPVIFVWTHDSVGLGEDGPTHQPVEHLMSLRAMPHFTLIRPADPNEASEAWRVAMQHREGPIGLVLSRQKLPVIDPAKYAAPTGLARGAYVLAEAAGGSPRLILIASGSEVALALEARERLESEGIGTRVVSMPSWELFEKQDRGYREQVLPATVVSRLSIEAGSKHGWKRWVGDRGESVGLERFGASAPGEIVLKELGFNVENVVAMGKALLGSEPRTR
jgi:transketolase